MSSSLHPSPGADDEPRVLRWGLEHVLPRVVSHADHAEITMFALGASTAPRWDARVLSGVTRGHGDVIIVSAGSAGVAQTYAPGSARHAARL